ISTVWLCVPAHRAHPPLHSFPTRRSSDLLGATLSLPLLEAMLPAWSIGARAAAKPVHRFLAFYVPNGMAMEYWSPKGQGTTFERSEEHTSELQSRFDLVCRLLLVKKEELF